MFFFKRDPAIRQDRKSDRNFLMDAKQIAVT